MTSQPDITVIRLPHSYTYVARYCERYQPDCYDYPWCEFVVAETLIPQVINGGIHVVNDQGMHGVIDLSGNEIIPCQHIQIDVVGDKGALTSCPAETGNEPDNGPIVEWPEEISFGFEDTGEQYHFLPDILRRYQPRLNGFALANGKEVIPCKYDNIYSYFTDDPDKDRFVYIKESDEPIEDESSTYLDTIVCQGIVNREGEEAFSLDGRTLGYGYAYSNGIVFPVQEEGKWGAVNEEGKQVIPCTMNDICLREVPQGDAKTVLVVFQQGEKWGVHECREGLSIEASFDTASEGFTAAQETFPSLVKWEKESKERRSVTSYFFQDRYEPRYPGEEGFELQGFAVESAKGKMGYVNENGKSIVPKRYTWVRPLGKRSLLALGYRTRTIQIEGFEGECEEYRKYQEGVWLYNAEGKRVFSRLNRRIIATTTGKIVAVSHSGIVEFYDEETRKVTRREDLREFKEFTSSAPYYLITGNDGYSGLADGNGNVVLPMDYRDIDPYIHVWQPLFSGKHRDGTWCIIAIGEER